MMRLETQHREKLPLDVLTYLSMRKARTLQADAYPDTGESGEAYEDEIASEAP